MRRAKNLFLRIREGNKKSNCYKSLQSAYFFMKYALSIPRRVKIASSYLSPKCKLAVKWLFNSREASNFTYDLTFANREYLAHLLSVVTQEDCGKIKRYIAEIESNKRLKKHIDKIMSESSERYNIGPLQGYGRRSGWYALVRILKPQIVMETGVDWGLGSCILVEALKKNQREGYPGKYFGTDIRPEAGVLFTAEYRKYGEILYGDSINSLKKFKSKIDLFINDSDHRASYEAREYNSVDKLLSSKSVIVGDNSHVTLSLCKFAEKTGREFIFFKEEPADHWYPGAGMGIAWKNNKRRVLT